MKAKVCLFLAAGLVVFLLGGMVVNQMVQAQDYRMQPYIPGMSVTFPEDPLRQHGLQIVSFFSSHADAAGYIYVGTIPTDKRLIITDISCGQSTGNSTWSVRLSTDGVNNEKASFVVRNNSSLSLRSGIPFEPGEELHVELITSLYNEYVTISGYYIDV